MKRLYLNYATARGLVIVYHGITREVRAELYRRAELMGGNALSDLGAALVYLERVQQSPMARGKKPRKMESIYVDPDSGRHKNMA